MRVSKEILLLFFLILAAIPVIYHHSSKELDNKISLSQREVQERVRNIELLQKFMANMPALIGAIQFQSYGQVEIVAKQLMSDERTVKEFFILDSNLKILHSVVDDYNDTSEIFNVLANWNRKSNYVIFEGDLFVIRKIDESEGYGYVILRVDVSDTFDTSMESEEAFGIIFRKEVTPKNFKKFEAGIYESPGARTRYFLGFVKDNFTALILVILGIALGFHALMKVLITPFRKIVFFLQNLSTGEIRDVKLEGFPRIFRPYIKYIIEANERIISANKQERETELQKAQFSVAQQVAHDIKSPLGLLKSLRNDLKNDLSLDKWRVLQSSLNRIEEIALNLLKKNPSNAVESEKKTEDLLPLVEGILVEKRAEFKEQQNVEIEGVFTDDSYGLFSDIRPSFLKRIISNLINNSVEACGSNSCSIKVGLYSEKNFNCIKVIDNGAGIAPEFIESVFKKGFTTKKEGNGLGLSGAKEEIEIMGGRIELYSTLGQGTTVLIRLPSSQVASSVVKKIDLYKYNRIIVLDDEQSVHDLWDRKLLKVKQAIDHFYSPSEFLVKFQNLNEKTLLLCDFEFVGADLNGIEVIEKINHAEHSLLVTGRADEDEIIRLCEKVGLQYLSKTLLPYVNISIQPPRIILIDDDRLSHWRWSQHQEKDLFLFQGFYSIDSFIAESSGIPRDSYILLDSDLGNGIKGEIEGQKIFQLGFNRIYLYTSYPDGPLEMPHWILDVFGKEPAAVLRRI